MLSSVITSAEICENCWQRLPSPEASNAESESAERISDESVPSCEKSSASHLGGLFQYLKYDNSFPKYAHRRRNRECGIFCVDTFIVLASVFWLDLPSKRQTPSSGQDAKLLGTAVVCFQALRTSKEEVV